MPKVLIDILMFLVLITVGFWALVRYLESASVFFPVRSMGASPSAMGLPWDDAYFRTKDNVILNGWHIKNPRARSTIIFAHGNAGNISDRLFKLKFFMIWG